MQRIAAGLLVFVSMMATMAITPLVFAPAASAACSDTAVLGITPWYRGLQEEKTAKDGSKSCQLRAPKDGNVGRYITTIALNVLQAAFTVAAYVAVFFIIKGGFNYMTSAGSSDGMANAKKTIVNAVIGLVIVLLSASIINTIVGVL